MKNQRIYLLLLFIFIAFATADDDDVETVTADLPEATPEPSYEDGRKFKSAILNTTNQYREEHSAPPLTWNETLATFSARHAKKCDFEHSGGPYGENLAIGYPNASATVVAWGDEREDYNYKKGKFKKKTGHFTQLVWNSTEEVGCGRQECGDDRGWMVVCEYWPRGNVEGEFEEMVGEEEDSAETLRVRLGLMLGLLGLWILAWV